MNSTFIEPDTIRSGCSSPGFVFALETHCIRHSVVLALIEPFEGVSGRVKDWLFEAKELIYAVVS
jgi:CRISPR/Cas system endoribonuclease Cas6 (RAMP superfamily)